ncbi:MAG TPA: spondin domain-containing protein [Pyrinomonadaceae bacterium]|nr:spondin domain-containing protein [Pyrinomonadaceae bacterium]
MKYRKLAFGLAFFAVALSAQFAVATATRKEKPTRFTVRVENVSSGEGQTAADGSSWPFALSPGMFVLSEKSGLLFAENKRARANGLEAQAEDGNPEGLMSSLEKMHHASLLHAIFNTPVGTKEPGPIGPGAAYEFTFTATPKMKLFMILMFGQSNDLFYAPDARGIVLFDSKGRPFEGEVTEQLILWDAGTEVNEEEGVGPNQAPRQMGPNTGAAENSVVKRARSVRFYGKNGELFRVSITPEAVM